MKKNKARNLVNSMKLAGLMSFMTLAGCCCDCGCHDCGCHEAVVKEKPVIDVDGDAIIINGDNNDAILIKGNGNNSANRCSGDNNQNRGAVRTKPQKPVNPVVKPQEPKPEPECKTVTTTTYEHFCISGDANDVIDAAIKIATANERH